jgi:undecaprenyl-diphosphatase
MAQFSFLMVLIPILGEQCLDLLKAVVGSEPIGEGVGVFSLAIGFAGAFFAGLFACKAMIAIVRKARLSWFALYCLAVAVLIFIFA